MCYVFSLSSVFIPPSLLRFGLVTMATMLRRSSGILPSALVLRITRPLFVSFWTTLLSGYLLKYNFCSEVSAGKKKKKKIYETAQKAYPSCSGFHLQKNKKNAYLLFTVWAAIVWDKSIFLWMTNEVPYVCSLKFFKQKSPVATTYDPNL